MANVEPGEARYEDSDRITQEKETAAGNQGDAVAFGANGTLVAADGSNGFAGILGSPAEAGSVAVQKHGITPANVKAGVTAGDALEPKADSTLGGVGDGSGGTTPAGPGDIRAESDESGGVAEVYVP